MDTNAYLFFLYSIIFWLLSYLIIRRSKSSANMLFSISTFLFGVGTLFSALGWGPFASSNYSILILSYNILINQLTFFAIAASFIVIAPLGIYFSGRTILHGNSGYKDEMAFVLYFIFIVIAVFNLFIYSTLTTKDNFIFEDTLTAFILILSILIYFNLFKQIPEYRANFTIIILGFLIGLLSLITSIALFFLNYDTIAEVVRSMGPFLGVLIVLISFTNLPQSIRNRNS